MKSEHLSVKNIEDYVDESASESEMIQFDAHMSECSECAEKMRQSLKLKLLWEQWSAKTHTEALQNSTVFNAFTRIINNIRNPAWSQRLHSWLADQGGKATAALRVVCNAPGEASRLILEGVDSFTKSDKLCSFSYAQSNVRVRGTADTPFVQEKKVEGTLEGYGVKVQLNEIEHTLEVKLENIQGATQPPLVMLLPEDEKKAPHVSEPKSLSGTTEYRAVFKAIPPGRYTLLFEPSSIGD